MTVAPLTLLPLFGRVHPEPDGHGKSLAIGGCDACTHGGSTTSVDTEGEACTHRGSASGRNAEG